MVNNIRIRQIFTSSLSCEPILRRTKNGELLCICQCDGPAEPHIENRVYVFHSSDNGETWSERVKLYPESNEAVYCTEVSVADDEITAYLTVHSGRFLHWKCVMMRSYDNGYNWVEIGAPPHLSEYTFIRGRIDTKQHSILIPYQHYPVTQDHVSKLLNDAAIEDKYIENTHVKTCETGVLLSRDNGETYSRHIAANISLDKNWIWTEPTLAELSDGRIAMLLRMCGNGYLWYTESADGGQTWSDIKKTDIPNPSNKPKLIQCYNQIALLNTPNNSGMKHTRYGKRYPLELWLSNDDMKTWYSKTILSDFPGNYCYCDGFYENGHLYFSVEHNRHTILFFDVELTSAN